MSFPKPFDGAISRYYAEDFPKALRERVRDGDDKDMLSNDYPYERALKRKSYDQQMDALQIELQKLQRWTRESGARILVIFEGRDAAGKGGTIQRFTQNLNPRGARIVALSKPSDVERGQWYFQRYVSHLPGAGEITFFDRSWYNRAGVETVMGFCQPNEREHFFTAAPEFERMLVEDGVLLFKIWLTVGRAEQMRRFLAREADPLKQWKLSPIDVASLQRWHEYTAARDEMFARTHRASTPWRAIRTDCKKRGRLAAIREVLHAIPYAHRDEDAVGEIDARISITPEQVAMAENS